MNRRGALLPVPLLPGALPCALALVAWSAGANGAGARVMFRFPSQSQE